MFISQLILSYQKYVSPLTHNLLSSFTGSTHSCRFTPTCSEYTLQAIDKYGSAKGLYLGFKRFLRCHPFSQGGFDPVK